MKNILANIITVKSLVLAMAIACSTVAYGQLPEQDCFNAIPVCQSSYAQANSYVGSGAVGNEISNNISCLGAGELNAVWYIVTVQADGYLSFNITPNVITNDYDWAVFNLTNASCTDIANDATLQVSCNFSGSTFPTPVTGANGGTNPQDEDSIAVLTGETYVICVSNFSTTDQGGYNLDFLNSPILDVTPPGVIGVTQPIPCGSTTLTFTFNENVLCSSAQIGDFQLTGPGGPYTLSNLSGAACTNGGTFEDEFTFTVDPPLTASGHYILGLVGPVTDNCGNAAPLDTFGFNIQSVDGVLALVDEFCGQGNGTASVVANGGTPPYTYLWSTGATADNISNLSADNYSLTITDDGGCQAILPFVIADPLSFDISIVGVNDTCSEGLGGAQVTVIGGSGNFTYSWSPLGAPVANPTGLGPNTYTVTVSDATNPGCSHQAAVTILDVNDVKAEFYAQPAVMSYLEPSTIFKNTSINADAYIWDFGDNTFDFADSPGHDYPPTPGIYNVTLIASSARGCTDTIMHTVRIDYQLNFYVPSAFSPNGDQVNEEFQVYSDGINYNAFEMQIFDRWGQQVFATTNPFEKWNGAYFNEGDILADGIYVYHVNFTQLYDVTKHTFIGRIALIK